MKPTKVFGIGLSKTGTTSLTSALGGLGYRAIHYPPLPDLRRTLADYDAAADTSDADFALVPAAGAAALPAGEPVTQTGIESAGPNPFNPTTTLHWSLLHDGRVRIAVYDARGRRVRRLADGIFAGPARYRTVWDGRDDGGHPAPSGVYFARFEAPPVTRSIRLLLVK